MVEGPNFGRQDQEDAALEAFLQSHPRDRGKLKQQVEEVLSRLTTKQSFVLRERFGLKTGQSRTLADIGQEMQITPSSVWGLEHRALRRLRHPSI
ncbi:hypothetical protein HYZ05_00300 [Candidatus Daviesbacteria bacterium]|nr:hypothetical protein [Candidatus Daviesbacteria bacterium]